MSKIWYNKKTGDATVFDDAEDMSNWPNFQEAELAPPTLTEEQVAEQVRTQRNLLLEASDIMAISDRITDEWRTYRQALRDVPAQSGFPTNVTWPVEPS
jgi:phosphoglycolate phosphatase-like HAD superfamily hydrolase